MPTVAAISFRDNHSLSMDVENVTSITISAARQVDDETWFCELMVRSAHGIVVMNLLASDPHGLQITSLGME